MDLTNEQVGKRIRKLRLQKSMTQEQLADSASLHFTYIGRVERGEKKISVQALNNILTALNSSFSDFFYPFEKNQHTKEHVIYEEVVYPILSLDMEDQAKVLTIINLVLEGFNRKK